MKKINWKFLISAFFIGTILATILFFATQNYFFPYIEQLPQRQKFTVNEFISWKNQWVLYSTLLAYSLTYLLISKIKIQRLFK